MHRSVPFVLWLIPIVFLVVELGDQGLLGETTFWFLLVVLCLFAARSLGIIGESSDRKEESLQPRSREEIEEVESAVQPYVVVQGNRSDSERVEFEGRPRKGAEETVAALEKLFPREKVTLSEGESGLAKIAVTPRESIEPSSNKPKLWLQVSLFLLTILTTTWAGASQVGVDLMSDPSQFMVGLPFSVGLLAILSAHELGHFFAARSHGMIVAAPALWWGLQNSLILKGPAAGELFRFISVDVGSSMALAIVSKLALGSALLQRSSHDSGSARLWRLVWYRDYRASDQRGLGVGKAAWEQHRLGEAASLMRDRNLLGVKVQAIPRGGQRLVLVWICACI